MGSGPELSIGKKIQT
jgi:hypothetical protein